MKKRTKVGVISACLCFIALWISGCAIDPKDAEVKEILAGTRYSSGWVGLEVAFKMHGLSASHTIVSVAEGTPASKAGIRVGDEIIQIGSENAGYIDTKEVARRLREAAPALALLVKRKGEKDFLSFVMAKADTSSAQRLEPPKGATAGGSLARAQEPAKAAPIGDQATDIRAYTTEWGFKVQHTANNDFVVSHVTPRSPAEDAGLKTGDVIMAMNSVPLKGSSDYVRPPFVPVKLLVRREGAEIERTILPRGIVRLKVSDIQQTFSIPGVPAHENPTAVSAVDALDLINVLDRVVLDPKSGQIAIIGHYDRAYDTGRIPYLDLLKTAMANPLPILNLHETPETKKEMIAAGDKTRSDLKLMVDAVRGHPDFERERQLMIRELAKAYGLTPQEYVDWYNYVKLDNKKEILPPQPIRDIQVRVFSNLGYADVAEALKLSFVNTPDAAVKALQVLGHGEEARSILGSNPAGTDGMRGELMAAAYLAIPQTANIVSGKELEPLLDWYRTKKITWEVVIKNVQNLLMPYAPKGKKDSNIMVEAFTRIFLSPKAVQFLEGLPTPYVQVEAIDLDSHSQLARIMYEADYALKSLSVMPELFQNIPGSLSRMEYQNKHGMFFEGTTLRYHQWLEPRMVDMKVSPDHRVINFTSSQMRYLFADNSKYWEAPPNEELERGFAAWCGHFMDHYDAYARVVPAFHKIREAAKVMALAKWALAQNIPLDLRSVTQEKWSTPEKVPAYWVLSQGIYQSGRMATIRAFEGGVSFKTRGSWTQVAPSATTTTETSAQLTLSALIGQKAVQAAESGNLENARYLAELSAQALVGGLSRGDLAKMNIVLPEAKPVPVSPVSMQLQKEMIKATSRQIAELAKNPASGKQATATLSQIDNLYKQVQDNPVAASDYLKKLQTGQLTTLSSAPSQQPQVVAKPAVWAPCNDPAIHDKTLPLTPERRAFLTDRLFEARERLKYINIALRNLIAINESQRAEIEKATQEISKAYDESVDRAWSVGFDLLTSLPADKFLDNYEVAKSKLNNAMKYRTGLLTTPLDDQAKKQIQSEILHIQVAKERLSEIYEGSKRLLDIFKDANYTYDFDKWSSQAQLDYKTVQEAALILGKILLEPKFEKFLATKAFFAGEKYFQVAAMGRMAYYGMGFFLDILAQKLAWEPLTGNLQNNLKDNTQAMEHLREKAAGIFREIGCIENALR